jgi:hypothetical protein
MPEEKQTCDHIMVANTDAEPMTPDGCQECLESGDDWVESGENWLWCFVHKIMH